MRGNDITLENYPQQKEGLGFLQRRYEYREQMCLAGGPLISGRFKAGNVPQYFSSGVKLCVVLGC